MIRTRTAAAARVSDEFERFLDLAGDLNDAQLHILAGVLEAVRILEAGGDQAAMEQLFRDAAALLTKARG